MFLLFISILEISCNNNNNNKWQAHVKKKKMTNAYSAAQALFEPKLTLTRNEKQ